MFAARPLTRTPAASAQPAQGAASRLRAAPGHRVAAAGQLPAQPHHSRDPAHPHLGTTTRSPGWDFSRIAILASDRPEPSVAAAPRVVQRKLAVGRADDPLEQEADRIAAQVMGVPEAAAVSAVPLQISRRCTACAAEETVHTKRSGGVVEAAAPAAATALEAGGRPLDSTARRFFEPRFGRDFSDVRIHTHDRARAAARAIEAHAYTLGRDIAFAEGQYAPATPDGRRLIAHELAHVVQQSGAPERTAVIRRDDAPAPAPSPDPATTASAGGTAATAGGKDVTLVYDRVNRITVSCAQNAVTLETRRATYRYKLFQCDRSVPAGDYTADVRADDRTGNVTLHLDVPGQQRYLFKAGFYVRAGQPSPFSLLKDQDKVDMTFGGTVGVGAPEGRDCAIALAPRELFGPGSDQKDLSDLLPKVPTLKWDLANFGLADVSLRLGISASAAAGYEYKAGRLDDICLTPTLKHPLAGRAVFSTGGRVDIHFDVTIGAELAVEALLIDVLTVHGELTLNLDAAASGDIATLVEIEADPDDEKSSKLKTDVELAALAALEANLAGSAGIDFLGFSLWEAHVPNILTGGLSYGWTGGLSFDDSFTPTPMLGTFAKATPQQLQAGVLRTTAPKRPARKKESIPIGDIVESWVHSSTGELLKDGSSCGKALPLQWFKPRSLYPRTITFLAPGVVPSEVTRDADPTLVSHPAVPTTTWRGGKPAAGEPVQGPTWIGVVGENWPDQGSWAQCFVYLDTPGRRDESNAFRQLMRGLDARFDGLSADQGTVQIDHVRELQFGGEDSFANLWPFDASANPSAGSLHQKQIAAYRKMLKNVNGRHFKIATIGLTPSPPPGSP